MNKLYRSRIDRVLAGVCGGMSQYFRVDSTIFRLLFVFFTIISGILPLTLVYLIAIPIIPIEPANQAEHSANRRFFRSSQNRMIAGVCGAFGEMWDVDPTVIRLCTVFLCLLTGILPLALIYCLGWIVIPLKKT
jgi:phage shock protein PspC (stress-responsive transcriptional regulator)